MEVGERAADASYRAWLRERAATTAGGRIGTAATIDDAARARAAGSVRTGVPVSLARAVEPPGCEVDVHFVDGPVAMGGDRVVIECHGRANTHLDALNHIGLDGRWYGGWSVDDPDSPTVVDLARHGLVTRGVVVDVPATRGTDWADASQPVTSDDIERALSSTGTEFLPGDALLLCMGRDRFEAAGNQLTGQRDAAVVPGVGRSAAEWIADHGVSALCWDFLDSNHPDEPFVCVHLLLWAIGLVLVDNCELSAAASWSRATGRATGALVLAPLAIPGGTGSLVHPLLLT
jgi:kynurenine formamidase